MTKPIQIGHLDGCARWWGGETREGRVGTELTWKVTIDQIKERGYNLDIRNPHIVAHETGDPAELLEQLTEAESKAAALQQQLRTVLKEALLT